MLVPMVPTNSLVKTVVRLLAQLVRAVVVVQMDTREVIVKLLTHVPQALMVKLVKTVVRLLAQLVRAVVVVQLVFQTPIVRPKRPCQLRLPVIIPLCIPLCRRVVKIQV